MHIIFFLEKMIDLAHIDNAILQTKNFCKSNMSMCHDDDDMKKKNNEMVVNKSVVIIIAEEHSSWLLEAAGCL
jgi:hypothetical protein